MLLQISINIFIYENGKIKDVTYLPVRLKVEERKKYPKYLQINATIDITVHVTLHNR
jgi:hypothetical protein